MHLFFGAGLELGGSLEGGAGGIACGEYQDAAFGEGLLYLRGIAFVECAAESPYYGMGCLEQASEHLLFEWRLEAADYVLSGADHLSGSLESLRALSGRYFARGEDGDGGAVQKRQVPRVGIVEVHKKRGLPY